MEIIGNKTKIISPRPVKQQQECIIEKNFCCNTHVCYQKITWYKKRQKVMFLYLLPERTQVLIAFQHYKFAMSLCHTASCRAQQCWKQDQNYKTKTNTKTKAASPGPRQRPRPKL